MYRVAGECRVDISTTKKTPTLGLHRIAKLLGNENKMNRSSGSSGLYNCGKITSDTFLSDNSFAHSFARLTQMSSCYQLFETLEIHLSNQKFVLVKVPLILCTKKLAKTLNYICMRRSSPRLSCRGCTKYIISAASLCFYGGAHMGFSEQYLFAHFLSKQSRSRFDLSLIGIRKSEQK